MRTLQSLVKKHEGKRLWIYLRSKELQQKFMEEAFAIGAIYPNGDVKSAGYVMGFGDDLNLCHVSIYVWCSSFQRPSASGLENVVKIDYQKYLDGEEDYVCREPHMSGYLTIDA